VLSRTEVLFRISPLFTLLLVSIFWLIGRCMYTEYLETNRYWHQFIFSLLGLYTFSSPECRSKRIVVRQIRASSVQGVYRGHLAASLSTTASAAFARSFLSSAESDVVSRHLGSWLLWVEMWSVLISWRTSEGEGEDERMGIGLMVWRESELKKTYRLLKLDVGGAGRHWLSGLDLLLDDRHDED
jgi:hypothetical protein